MKDLLRVALCSAVGAALLASCTTPAETTPTLSATNTLGAQEFENQPRRPPLPRCADCRPITAKTLAIAPEERTSPRQVHAEGFTTAATVEELTRDGEAVPQRRPNPPAEGQAIQKVDVRFSFASAELNDLERADLLKALRGRPTRRIIVRGHTSGSLASATNRDLAMTRADNVRAFLTSHATPTPVVVMPPLGRASARAGCERADAALDRRVEVSIERTSAPL